MKLFLDSTLYGDEDICAQNNIDFEIRIQAIAVYDEEDFFESFEYVECVNECPKEQAIGGKLIKANFQIIEKLLLSEEGEPVFNEDSFCHHDLIAHD